MSINKLRSEKLLTFNDVEYKARMSLDTIIRIETALGFSFLKLGNKLAQADITMTEMISVITLSLRAGGNNLKDKEEHLFGSLSKLDSISDLVQNSKRKIVDLEQLKIDLEKKVYSKVEYTRTIDTQFVQLGVPTVAEIQEDNVTVEQFFGYYNDLFYDIPLLGNVDSHEYLILTSGAYANITANSEEIEALQEEISTLRAEVLTLQLENANLITGVTGSLKEEIDQAIGIEGQTASVEGTTTMNTNIGGTTNTGGNGY